MRKFIIGATTALALVVAVFAFPAGAQAMSVPHAVEDVILATNDQYTVRPVVIRPGLARCVSGTTLARLSYSSLAEASTLMGLAEHSTGKTWFHAKRVCQQIVAYARTGRLYDTTVAALATVGHEAAHVRGVRNEARAECAGVRFAWRYLKESGAFAKYAVGGIRRTLLSGLNAYRSAEYRLGPWCQLT